MKIVVLDGYTLNPGDLSWRAFEALGDCVVHERMSEEEIPVHAADADAVLTNKIALSQATLAQLPKLRYIGVTATGYNMVDVDAARAQGVTVANVPDYSTASVAQMVFAHLLNLTQRVGDHAAGVRAGRWAMSEDFCYWDYPLIELEGLALGIVGYGRIGRATADLGLAFGMRVFVNSRQEKRTPPGVQWMELEPLLRASDVVSLHCPLTPETRGLIDRERLAWLKPTAYLINTSRGPLVDEDALAEALRSGRLAGAGLDVLASEPPPAEHPLYQAPHCYITPHIAWATRAARARLMKIAAANLSAFAAGAPQNVVNAVL